MISDAAISILYLSSHNGSQRDQEKILVQAQSREPVKAVPTQTRARFSKKQIARIEYMEIAEDDKCKTFWVRGFSLIRFEYPILFKYCCEYSSIWLSITPKR